MKSSTRLLGWCASMPPKVAIIGRPNVGKSTLVNRLAGRRGSIVGALEGITRDRIDTDVSWGGRDFILSDTGGVVEATLSPDASITGKVAARAIKTLEEADLVLFVVDVVTGVTSDELALAVKLRRIEAPLIVVANKVDNDTLELDASELWSLGLGEPMMVSSTHGRGSGDLLDRIVDLLPPPGDELTPALVPSIALVGRPNVGKSSIFNRLVGEERSIVHHEAGTTRDTIDTVAQVDGTKIRFIDTAGMRRRAKTQGVEIFSASRTRSAIERADLAILVVDAFEGATSQDQRIAEQVADSGVGAIIALNKWDLLSDSVMAEAAELSMKDRLHFIDYAPLVRTSATTKRGMAKLTAAIAPVIEGRNQRVSTGPLNRLILDAQQKTPAPRVANKSVKILYATQASVAPPTFVLFTTGKLSQSWTRYIQRTIRDDYGFLGNPIRIVIRERIRDDSRRR